MRLKKLISMAVAALFTTAFLVGAGVGETDALAADAMNVNAAISGSNVVINASATGAPSSEDGTLYLFAEPIYSDAITTEPLATAPAGPNASFTTPLNLNSANSRLYSKFYVCAKRGGAFVKLNPGNYITNPEAVATHTAGRLDGRGKNGLLTAPEKLNSREFQDLGVKQVLYNIYVGRLLGPTENGAYPTINYNYNGKNYQFNGLCVAEYDNIISTYNSGGCSVTMCLINGQEFAGRSPQLVHPLSRGVACPCYMYNTADASGTETLAAIAAFLGERYSGAHGKVDNWVVGNEVNIKDQWNYVNIGDLTAYCQEYMEGFRIFYNGIKSKNANARIYICTEHQWDRNPKGVFSHDGWDGKDFDATFNAVTSASGNIDWGLMTHPYPVPLTWATDWNSQFKGLMTHSPNTAFVSMSNFEVVTDFFSRPEMLAPNGQVRSIIAGCGYTTSQGEANARAALVLGYQAAMMNQHVDAFFVAQELDNAASLAQGLAVGLSNPDGSHKTLYDCFKQLDGPNAAQYQAEALAIRGVGSFGDVISAR
ncbi:MAG: hypothetical protein K5641_01275 [Lachnospiraceae bacterium]|nr:hypothetical protein [Lachnospiraceae bacterium]